jgi:biotin transport system substrate-specific component
MSTLAASSSHTKVRDLAYIALMAALLAICAWITIPIGAVPFTLQTFGVFAALSLLGGRRGTIVILVYICLGLIGLPVFAGFNSGAGVLLGATGGYIWGFIAMGLVYWAITAKLGEKLPVQIVAQVLGLVICYALGSVWFLQVYTAGDSVMTMWGVLAACVIPFVIPDLVKLALALVISNRVKKQVKL